MNRTTMLGLMLTLLLASTAVAQMGTSAGHDLDALWARAQADYDLDGLDALLLLESKDVTVTEGFDLVTRIHRVVWVGTRAGQNAHADLRIPWNSATSTFEVEALRTWRDGRWWPDPDKVSDTAVVETLPYAVRTAWDHQDLRETMLLHDGVETPCIMETSYTITERGGASPAADGSFVFTRREPAVQVVFGLNVPVGVRLDHAVGNGASEPAATRDVGASNRRWSMSDVPRRLLPGGDPMAMEPYVRWSTWGDDPAALDARLKKLFTDAALASPAMADSAAGIIATNATTLARARAAAALVDDMTRHVHLHAFDRKLELRDAARVWNTGYATDTDRASLAYVLFRDAGLKPAPVLVNDGPAAPADGLVGMFDDALMLRIGHPAVLYDPANGEVRAPADVVDEHHGSSFALDLALAPGDDGWTGRGSLQASGLLNPWPDLNVDGAVGGVLSGAETDGLAPEWFDTQAAAAGFDLTLARPQADDAGRIRLEMGAPTGGLVGHLPHGIDLWRQARTSPVLLRAPMSQHVALRLTLGDAAVVHAPEPRELVNEVGRFVLAVDQKDGVLTVTRELELTVATITPEQWPMMRALLLEEADPANGMILLRED